MAASYSEWLALVAKLDEVEKGGYYFDPPSDKQWFCVQRGVFELYDGTSRLNSERLAARLLGLSDQWIAEHKAAVAQPVTAIKPSEETEMPKGVYNRSASKPRAPKKAAAKTAFAIEGQAALSPPANTAAATGGYPGSLVGATERRKPAAKKTGATKHPTARKTTGKKLVRLTGTTRGPLPAAPPAAPSRDFSLAGLRETAIERRDQLVGQCEEAEQAYQTALKQLTEVNDLIDFLDQRIGGSPGVNAGADAGAPVLPGAEESRRESAGRDESASAAPGGSGGAADLG